MLAKLGDVLFAAKSLPFSSLCRESSGRWVTHESLKGGVFLQFAGKRPLRVKIAGSLLTSFHDGSQQLERLHDLVNKGEAVPFSATIDDVGKYLGMWAVLSVKEERTLFDAQGFAKKIDFSLELMEVPNARNTNATR